MVLVVQISAQSRAETYTATASVKTAGGASVTAPVAIDVAEWTTDAERKQLADVLKSGGDAALLKQLASMKTRGKVTVGKTEFDAKYAYAMTSSEGRIITLVTTTPMFFVGAGAPSAKPTTGHRFGVVTIEVNNTGSGQGTLSACGDGADVRVGCHRRRGLQRGARHATGRSQEVTTGDSHATGQ